MKEISSSNLISKKPKTVRDEIVTILGNEFPLTAKEIFVRVQRQNTKGITYQAAHKALKEMLAEKMIIKTNSRYEMDKDWIGNLKNYATTLEQTYSGKKDIVELMKKRDQEPVHVKFNDLSELCTVVARIGAERMLVKENIPYYTIINHGWFPLRFNFTDFLLLEKLNANYHQSMCIIVQNTPFDRWICQQYRSTNETNKGYTIIDPTIGPIQEDAIATGDYVIRMKFSNETIAFLDKVYKEIHGLQDLLKFYYKNKMGTFKPEIELTIERNPLLTQLIAEKVQKHMHANKEYQQFRKAHAARN